MAEPLSPLESLGAGVATSLDEDGGARERAVELARFRFTANVMKQRREHELTTTNLEV